MGGFHLILHCRHHFVEINVVATRPSRMAAGDVYRLLLVLVLGARKSL